jgi:hypothetical protein
MFSAADASVHIHRPVTLQESGRKQRDSMDKELQMLTDKSNIVETINQLFLGTDNRDWVGARTRFAPRVLFDMSSPGGCLPEARTPEGDYEVQVQPEAQ